MPCEPVTTAHRPWRRLALCAALVFITGAASACADTTSDESSDKKSPPAASKTTNEQAGPCAMLPQSKAEDLIGTKLRRNVFIDDRACSYQSLAEDAQVGLLVSDWEHVSSIDYPEGTYIVGNVENVGDEAYYSMTSLDSDESLLFILAVRQGERGLVVGLTGPRIENSDGQLSTAMAVAETALAHFDADPWGRLKYVAS